MDNNTGELTINYKMDNNIQLYTVIMIFNSRQ